VAQEDRRPQKVDEAGQIGAHLKRSRCPAIILSPLLREEFARAHRDSHPEDLA
jgi:hypothetical protein